MIVCRYRLDSELTAAFGERWYTSERPPLLRDANRQKWADSCLSAFFLAMRKADEFLCGAGSVLSVLLLGARRNRNENA